MDREKVIKGLEFTKAMITFNPSTGEDIEPENLNEANKTTYDACVGAIAMLKEQETVVHPEPSCEMTYITDCCCDLCGVQLIREDNYCRCCGRPIEWERR